MTVSPVGVRFFLTTGSTQATFLPSGEIAACSKVRAAKSVLMTSLKGAAVFGFSAAFGRALISCFVSIFSWAEALLNPSKKNETVAVLASHFTKRMSKDPFYGMRAA
jgi:hypothetical protein